MYAKQASPLIRSRNHIRAPARGAVLVVFLSISWLLAPTVQSQTVNPDAEGLYQRAWETYHLDYRPGEALEQIQPFLSRDDLLPGERITGLLLAATCQSVLDQDVAARQTLEKILAIDPDYRMPPRRIPPRLWHLYWELLASRGRTQVRDGIQTLAILDLSNNSVTDRQAMEGLGQAIADVMVGTLTGQTEVRIVERERIDFIRKEVGLQQTEAFDQQSAVRAGRLLGAQSLLLGGFVRLKDDLRIDVRIVNTETGEILKTRQVTGDFKDLFDLLHELGGYVMDDLGVVADLPPDARDADFGAFLEYSHGLVMLKMERLPEALAHFERAAALDEDFVEARERVQQLAPLLAGGDDRQE